MNKITLLGRLTRDPEVRYTTSAEPLCIAKFSLAVNRRYKREGEPDADFFNCVAMGKTGEFVEKYFQKGQQVCVVGRVQIRSYDNNGAKQWITEIIVEENYFADSKQGGGKGSAQQESPAQKKDEPFYTVDEPIDDSGLPF